MTKTYTLELTADEVGVLFLRGQAPAGDAFEKPFCSVLGKLRAARDAVAVDREADELRLPWRAELYKADGTWFVDDTRGVRHRCCVTERAAKLMSAANEWKMAALALHNVLGGAGSNARTDALALLEKAKRKEATGIPEED